MADNIVTNDLLNRLMAANEDAFAAGLFNAAYHALAGALHCARQLQDEAALRRVRDAAGEQLVWIDQNAPDYEHSSQSAEVRGHDSIFYLLARQAAASLEIANQRKKQQS